MLGKTLIMSLVNVFVSREHSSGLFRAVLAIAESVGQELKIGDQGSGRPCELQGVSEASWDFYAGSNNLTLLSYCASVCNFILATSQMPGGSAIHTGITSTRTKWREMPGLQTLWNSAIVTKGGGAYVGCD